MHVPLRPRVLLVEDDPILRRTFARVLAAAYDVAEAHDGAEALRVLGGDSFDAVVTDLEMPSLGGDGVVAWLETHRVELAARVIVVTGGAKDERQAAWLRAFDAARVLRKPCTAAELVAAVARVVPRS